MNNWKPVNRWKETVLEYLLYIGGGAVMGAGLTALMLWLVTFLGVEL